MKLTSAKLGLLGKMCDMTSSSNLEQADLG